MFKAPLYVAGIIFGLVALIHLYRIFNHFNIIIGTVEVPVWINFIGVIVAGGLSIWMFTSARCSKCGR